MAPGYLVLARTLEPDHTAPSITTIGFVGIKNLRRDDEPRHHV